MHGHSLSDYIGYYKATGSAAMEDIPEDTMSRPDPEGIIERAITPVIKEWGKYLRASQARFHSATYYLKDLYEKSGVSTIDDIEQLFDGGLEPADRANAHNMIEMNANDERHKKFMYNIMPLLKEYVDDTIRYRSILFVHGLFASDVLYTMVTDKLGLVERKDLVITEDFDEVLAHYQPLFRAIYISKYLDGQSASDGRFLKLTPGEADEGDYFEPEEEAQLDSDDADGEQPFEEDSSKRLAVAMAALARKEATEKQLTTEEVGPQQALHLENMEQDDPSDPYYGASTHSKFDYVRDVPELASSGPAIDTRPGTGQWPVDPPRAESDYESPEDGEEEEDDGELETDETDDYWVATAPDDDQVPADIQALVDRDIKYTNRVHAIFNRIFFKANQDGDYFTEDRILNIADAWADRLCYEFEASAY
ncbi:hypothetical protein IWQ60_012279 [Tieghemiomyces parasiticus]|uniref:Uncharacterized protein n=1 Tax=Tieghemiomyces parasiticus TaxID=78921 RepID=A0A9W8DKR7_9FUNG|nr:hypothetical protein IWQ60_012279 [Tieghemiomyces parasiticus]